MGHLSKEFNHPVLVDQRGKVSTRFGYHKRFICMCIAVAISMCVLNEHMYLMPDAVCNCNNAHQDAGVNTHSSTKNTSNNLNYTNKTFECRDSFKENHFMTLSNMRGRIGNNMFQFLSLMGTALDYCYTPVFTDEDGQNVSAIFDIGFIKQLPWTETEKWRTFRPHCYAKYDSDVRRLSPTYNWTLKGHFQSWRYFHHHEAYLRSVLQFRPQYLNDANNFLQKYSSTNNIHVCVHVRRGDMVTGLRSGYTVASVAYLRRAMQYYLSRNVTYFTNKSTSNFQVELGTHNTKFIFLSDDIKWCKYHFYNTNDPSILFSPFSSDARKDLALMNVCNHSIITSGTFGWMGAWLSGGSVVYFKGFPRPGSPIDQEMNREDYYLPDWVGML